MKKTLLLCLVTLMLVACGAKQAPSKSRMAVCVGQNGNSDFVFTTISDDEDKKLKYFSLSTVYTIGTANPETTLKNFQDWAKPLDGVAGVSYRITLTPDKTKVNRILEFDMAKFDYAAYQALGPDWGISWLDDYVDRAVNGSSDDFVDVIAKYANFTCSGK